MGGNGPPEVAATKWRVAGEREQDPKKERCRDVKRVESGRHRGDISKRCRKSRSKLDE